MSAASPTTQARRTEAAAPSRSVQQSAPPRQPLRAAPAFAFAAPSTHDEIRLNLGDIPRLPETMEIEGFKPSLLSRLFDLVAPLDKR